MNRYFRRDGHTWRRKKDGRTVGEAHERLKVFISCFLNRLVRWLFFNFYIVNIKKISGSLSILFISQSMHNKLVVSSNVMDP